MAGSGRVSPVLLPANEYLQAMQAKYPAPSPAAEVSRRKRRNRMSLFSRQPMNCEGGWKGYERIVGFDTMPDAEDTVSRSASYTLQVKSVGYARTKHTRTFMCAVDATESSERALEWIMENLVDDGDEIVAVRVLDEEQDGMSFRLCRHEPGECARRRTLADCVDCRAQRRDTQGALRV